MKNLIQKIGRLFSRKSESDELEIFLRSNTEMNLFKREDEVDIRKKEEDTQKKERNIRASITIQKN